MIIYVVLVIFHAQELLTILTAIVLELIEGL